MKNTCLCFRKSYFPIFILNPKVMTTMSKEHFIFMAMLMESPNGTWMTFSPLTIAVTICSINSVLAGRI